MTMNVDRIRDLLDYNDISKLVSDVGRCLDTKNFENLSNIYAADAILKTPDGITTGVDALTETARRNHEMYDLTQHLVAGISIELRGDDAAVAANIVAVFVPAAAVPQENRMIGCHYAFDATRTLDGWHFTSMSITPVWTR